VDPADLERPDVKFLTEEEVLAAEKAIAARRQSLLRSDRLIDTPFVYTDHDASASSVKVRDDTLLRSASRALSCTRCALCADTLAALLPASARSRTDCRLMVRLDRGP